jgi:phage terminase large subunit-like protein
MSDTLTLCLPSYATEAATEPTAEAAKCIEFIERFLCAPEESYLGAPLEPIRLMPWQKEFLTAVHERGTDGSYRHKTGYVQIPRRAGKTLVLAALAVWKLISLPRNGTIYIVAVSRDQARTLFDYAWQMCQTSPELVGSSKRAGKLVKNERLWITNTATNVKLKVVAADADTILGRSPDLVIADELAFWKNDRVWHAVANGLSSKPNAQMIAITTAGYDQEKMAYKLYSYGRAIVDGKIEAPHFLYRAWEAAANADIGADETWLKCNPGIGYNISLEEYRQDYTQVAVGTSPEYEWRMYRLNQWVSGGGDWVGAAAWADCYSTQEIPDKAPIFVAVDAAVHTDHTAIVWVYVDGDKRIVRSHIFPLPNDGEDFNLYEAENFIRWTLAAKYDIVAIGYDPYRFGTHAFHLESDGFTVIKFPQYDGRMIPASEYAKAEIRAKRVHHNGDAQLAAHVAGAVSWIKRDGERIGKGVSKNDAAVALAMALWLSDTLEVPEPEPQFTWSINGK